jgi:hypothetical protein
MNVKVFNDTINRSTIDLMGSNKDVSVLLRFYAHNLLIFSDVGEMTSRSTNLDLRQPALTKVSAMQVHQRRKIVYCFYTKYFEYRKMLDTASHSE